MMYPVGSTVYISGITKAEILQADEHGAWVREEGDQSETILSWCMLSAEPLDRPASQPFTLSVALSDEAFEGRRKQSELASLLREVAHDLEHESTSGALFDSNGTHVGDWKI